jgi:hypothetical protein
LFVFDLQTEKKQPESILEKMQTSPSLADEFKSSIAAAGEKKRGKLKNAVKNKNGK